MIRLLFMLTLAFVFSAVNAQENVGIGTTSPGYRLHVMGNAASTLPVAYIRNNYVGTADVKALELYSVPADAYGIGLYASGGYRGVLGIGVANTASTGSYGLYGTVTGSGAGAKYGVYGAVNIVSGGIHYGVYGTASGGLKNWSGYFSGGNAYISDSLWIGSNTGAARLDVLGGNWNVGSTEGDLRIGNSTYRLKIGVATGGGGAGDGRIFAAGGTNRIILGSSNFDVMSIVPGNSGSVVIGGNLSPATGYKLSVRGKIICEEILVQLQAAWPDYVFHRNYPLPPLSTVEQFIQKNQHLPNLPSAAEIQQKGTVPIGEMQSKLLEKIEELTLYVIEQEKQIKELQKQNALIQQTLQNQIKN